MTDEYDPFKPLSAKAATQKTHYSVGGRITDGVEAKLLKERAMLFAIKRAMRDDKLNAPGALSKHRNSKGKTKI